MATVVLIIHLLVCICLIGLVLLQRSEGGALGMGGGGGGALMSGRGAADALAKMTSVAGGFFLATSLVLTVLSGTATNAGNSVFDNFTPSTSAPAEVAPVAPAPVAPTTPDPTESSITPETQLASATIPAPVQAANNTTRAAPLGPSSAAAATAAPRQPAATTPAATRTTTPPRNTGAATVPTSAPARTTPAPATTRSTTGTTPAASTSAERPLVLPNTSGGVSGIALSDDPAQPTESIEIGNGVEAVRRERAGPDQ